MMAGLNQQFLRQLGAFATIGVIFAGLAIKGADGAALAALLAAALASLLAIALLVYPAGALAEAARRNLISIAAAGLFCAWALFTAWPIAADAAPAWLKALWHPFWAAFGTERGAISLSPYRTLEGLAAFAAPVAAFALGSITTTDRAERDRAARLFTAGAIAIAGLSLALHANGVAQQAGRLSGAFNSPNSAATLFGALTLILAALVLRAARGRLTGAKRTSAQAYSRWMAIAYATPVTIGALALTLACLFLTGSRAGITSLLGAFLLFFALVLPASDAPRVFGVRLNALVWIIAAMVGVLLLVGGDFLMSRADSVGADAADRRQMITTHWQAFLERPVFGHGLNTFHEINLAHTNTDNWGALHTIGAAHNIFVQMLEENGVFGALLFGLMLGPPLWRALTIARTQSSGAEYAAAVVAAFFFAFMHGLVDFGLQVPATGALFAFALGAFSGRVESPVAAAAEQPAPA
ncbi:MAG: O-antigen ligase family protein [Hyphomonadaceae bacterium]|nr:O-antigen ligase family protein [Hyphomonadaceae bacterium]